MEGYNRITDSSGAVIIPSLVGNMFNPTLRLKISSATGFSELRLDQESAEELLDILLHYLTEGD